MPIERLCAKCRNLLVLSDDQVEAVKLCTWADGDEYTSMEIDGWVLVWDQGELLAVCPCLRHLLPHHQDTGDVVVPGAAAEKA